MVLGQIKFFRHSCRLLIINAKLCSHWTIFTGQKTFCAFCMYLNLQLWDCGFESQAGKIQRTTEPKLSFKKKILTHCAFGVSYIWIIRLTLTLFTFKGAEGVYHETEQPRLTLCLLLSLNLLESQFFSGFGLLLCPCSKSKEQRLSCSDIGKSVWISRSQEIFPRCRL